VVILYPDGRVSPTQEAQLTMFNGVRANVKAYAVAGSFDDCHRLARQIFGDREIRRRIPLTSANSVNVGRLLPQSVYYFHAVGQLGSGGRHDPAAGVEFCVPSGNFGNLTAGLFAKRAGLPISQFVAATNANDVVPEFLETGVFTARPSILTLANAMDVGHPSNFERITWLYGGDLSAIRRDIAGARASDEQIRETIQDVYARTGYMLDPHSAVAYRGIKARRPSAERPGILLATAHPAKFSEIVEPIVGCPVEKPLALQQVIARPRHIVRIRADVKAVEGVLAA
jgi:threonine synthase